MIQLSGKQSPRLCVSCFVVFALGPCMWCPVLSGGSHSVHIDFGSHLLDGRAFHVALCRAVRHVASTRWKVPGSRGRVPLHIPDGTCSRGGVSLGRHGAHVMVFQ